MPEYKSRVEVGGGASGMGGEIDVEFMEHIETENEVASLEQRWANSWATSLRTKCVILLDMIFLYIYLCFLSAT